MLEAIAGGLITVTGVVFSVTIVALQPASTRFTPRVLRNFTTDRGNQLVPGVFIGTFTYTLLVLRTVRSADDGESPFVPRVAVTVAVVLVLVAIGFLTSYINHSVHYGIHPNVDRSGYERMKPADSLALACDG